MSVLKHSKGLRNLLVCSDLWLKSCPKNSGGGSFRQGSVVDKFTYYFTRRHQTQVNDCTTFNFINFFGHFWQRFDAVKNSTWPARLVISSINCPPMPPGPPFTEFLVNRSNMNANFLLKKIILRLYTISYDFFGKVIQVDCFKVHYLVPTHCSAVLLILNGSLG